MALRFRLASSPVGRWPGLEPAKVLHARPAVRVEQPLLRQHLVSREGVHGLEEDDNGRHTGRPHIQGQAATQPICLTCASSSVVARGPNSRSLLCSMIGLLATRRENEHPWLR